MTREAVEQRDQEDAGCKSPSTPLQCTNGCGHFGSPTTMNLCHICYGEYGQPILKSKSGVGRELPTLSLAVVEKIEQNLERSEVDGTEGISVVEEEARHAVRLSHTSTAGTPRDTSLTINAAQIDAIRNVIWTDKVLETSAQLAVEQLNDNHRKAKDDRGSSTLVRTGPVRLTQARRTQNQHIEEDDAYRSQPRLDQLLTTDRLSSSRVTAAKIDQVLNFDGSAATRVQAEKRPPPRNLCQSCRKRIGLTGFKCRCGNMYCAIHRYSDKHSCTYDYKLAGREAIAKANPLTVAAKVIRI